MPAFPKPTKQVKIRKRISRLAAKVNAWQTTRALLIERFRRAGITQCELRYDDCWRTNALSFAHSKKRRFIESQEQLEECALLCQVCHDRIEYSPNMYEIVRRVIASRKVKI